MTFTTNSTFMPHRPSRGAISRVALLAAYSRAGPSSRTDRFARPTSHLAADCVRPRSATSLNTSKSVFKPRKPVYLATFNVRSLKQAGQQVALARTLDSLSIDVCCLSETRTQDASTVIELTAPSLSSRFRLRTSGDAEAAAAGYAGVGIVLSERAEASLLDWIPVDSRLCAVRLATSVRESRGSVRKKRTPRLAIEKLVDPEVKRNYQNQLVECLPDAWRKPRGGQRMTWQKGVKVITKSLGVVGVVRLPGWGPRDPACAWLETLQEMAANRCQWRSCCQFLFRLSD
ncbi:hypothetical protein CLF_109407 [Clonorchis sinensis]|uniref:Endonuclease/exonuclease/phosphatase domain-containing protein n=1 Tax=Clonorchis sinensis TaxID=79923 RepID=G7YJB2_CLOSI|nr:hypothetical protein CLF_109407 [Clonorchis sinensis]